MNASKIEYIVLGHKRQLNRIGNIIPDLTFNNEVIKRVNKTNYQGIIIDDNLNWKGQYKIIKNKLKGGLSSLAKLKNILLQRKLDQVYRALFENHLRCSNIAWGNPSYTKQSQLQRLQTRANKLIGDDKHKDGWTCIWLIAKE